MKNSIKKIIKQQILILVCCFSFISYSQNIKLSENAQISILTCGSGTELYSIFGHTAIRVSDQIQQVDVVFNYGMFDFNTPNFYLKFIKGDLLYSVGIENYEYFIQYYKQTNRSIDEQYLSLSLSQKQKIWDKINEQLQTNERFYTYKFIDNNCTTKVVDLINGVLEKPIEVKFPENNYTNIAILNSYLSKNYFEKLGINLVFGKKVDYEVDKVFLPDKLMQSISISKNKNMKLEQNSINHYVSKQVEKKSTWNSIYFFSIICVILAFLSKNKYMQNILFCFLGVFGIVLIGISIFSNHAELKWNDTFLIINPLYLLLFHTKTRKLIVYILTICLLLFVIISNNVKLFTVFPLVFLFAVYLFQIFPRKRIFKS